MTDTRGKRHIAGVAQCEAHYSVELARDSSYIASTLTIASLSAAVIGVVDGFVRRHGNDGLSIFLKLLADRLDARENPLRHRWCGMSMRLASCHLLLWQPGRRGARVIAQRSTSRR